ncbi:MAG: asparaginase domain-containing protein [Flavobacteriaceae bacterium]
MIQIFVTGGTFDKSYNHIQGNLFFKDTHLPQMLDRSRCRLPLKVERLMMVDSLEMTASHWHTIVEACRETSSSKIVITHGTDQMVATAQHLANENTLQTKTIVLTGAMIPYAFGSSSDGFFNLGAALAWVQTLPPQVYIAMQGEIFDWNNVYKDREKGIFKRLKA